MYYTSSIKCKSYLTNRQRFCTSCLAPHRRSTAEQQRSQTHETCSNGVRTRKGAPVSLTAAVAKIPAKDLGFLPCCCCHSFLTAVSVHSSSMSFWATDRFRAVFVVLLLSTTAPQRYAVGQHAVEGECDFILPHVVARTLAGVSTESLILLSVRVGRFGFENGKYLRVDYTLRT